MRKEYFYKFESCKSISRSAPCPHRGSAGAVRHHSFPFSYLFVDQAFIRRKSKGFCYFVRSTYLKPPFNRSTYENKNNPTRTQLSRLFTTLQANPKPDLASNELIANYLKIQQGLAADDLNAAQVGAKAFTIAAHDDEALTAYTQAILATDEMNVARHQFLALSEAVIARVKAEGGAQGPLYLIKCPMAFEGSGGTWLQHDQTVLNPYYGAMMLHCGRVQETLSETSK